VENTNRALYLAEWAKAGNRLLAIAVGILVEHHLKTTDHLFDVRPEDRISGTPQASLERFFQQLHAAKCAEAAARRAMAQTGVMVAALTMENDSVTTLA
jgi:hypothetical protein